MALLHRAEISPTKLELLAAWLPSREWFAGSAAEVARVASFRFDDPAGQVGIETMLVKAGDGPTFQVPLTYRGAPLEEETWLVGTTMHSVLGPRWVYDACGDPVYLNALVEAMFGGPGQADEYIDVDGRLEHRERSMTVTADGDIAGPAPAIGSVQRVVESDPTVVVAGSVELAVARRLGGEIGGSAWLTGVWAGRQTPVPLVGLSVR